MNKIIIVPLLLCFYYRAICSDTIPSLKLLLSQQYSLEFSIEGAVLSAIDSSIDSGSYKGIVERNKDSIYSESKKNIGIARDSIVFFLNRDSKIISLDSRRIAIPLLAFTFCDPYEMMNYAEESKSSLTTTLEEGKLIYHYFLATNAPWAKGEIFFYFDTSDLPTNELFKIQLTYEGFGKLTGTFNYKLIPSQTDKKSIEDYVEMKNGEYILKPKFVKKYTFFNSLGWFEDE